MRSRLVVACLLAVAFLGLTSAQTTAAPTTSLGRAILQDAERYTGSPYCWYGGDASGPNLGETDPNTGEVCGIDGYDASNQPGFDCLGLTTYAVYQATAAAGDPVWLAHNPQQVMDAQLDRVQVITDPADLRVGDLVYFGGTLNDVVHAGIYAGNIDGSPSYFSAVSEEVGVETEPMTTEEVTSGEPFVGALRITPGTALR